MPTARARYRRRPVMDQLARGQLERWNPAEGGTAPTPPVEVIMLMENGSPMLMENAANMLMES